LPQGGKVLDPGFTEEGGHILVGMSGLVNMFKKKNRGQVSTFNKRDDGIMA
jgi:hypothetical protein